MAFFFVVFMFILLMCFHIDVTTMESSQDFNLILILVEVFLHMLKYVASSHRDE